MRPRISTTTCSCRPTGGSSRRSSRPGTPSPPLIPAERYLIGFSFYEEFDLNRWDDTSEPFEDSRALAYAQWQPEGETKAGVFSYAIDRDGVAFLDDEITETDYAWTRRLSQHLRAG